MVVVEPPTTLGDPENFCILKDWSLGVHEEYLASGLPPGGCHCLQCNDGAAELHARLIELAPVLPSAGPTAYERALDCVECGRAIALPVTSPDRDGDADTLVPGDALYCTACVRHEHCYWCWKHAPCGSTRPRKDTST
jgi:hypothetical protein